MQPAAHRRGRISATTTTTTTTTMSTTTIVQAVAAAATTATAAATAGCSSLATMLGLETPDRRESSTLTQNQ